jgi:hypothetical protein
MKYLEGTQLSKCTNVRMVYVGFIKFAYITPETPFLVSAMWQMLSALPSPNAVQEFWYRFTPYKDLLEDQLLALGFLESQSLLHKLQFMFPNLKMIKIILALYELEESESVLGVLRRLDDLRALEENGLLKLVTVNLMEHVACHSVIEGCSR